MQRRRVKERHSKVRTGCLTCKLRHVKCDEDRPVCQRCLKGGYKCEGYQEPPKAWIFEYSRDQPVNEVSSSSDSSNERTAAATSSTSSLESTPVAGQLVKSQPRYGLRLFAEPAIPYKGAFEQRAFKRFYEVTAPMLCRYSDPEVWTVAIPQSAWDHNAVRHSLIAATLIDEEHTNTARRAPCSPTALFHLNAAIRALLDDAPPVEVVLMSGLILQLAETLLQNAATALMHLRSAMRILAEYKLRIANGERLQRDQMDLIVHRLDPVLTVATQFAEATLAKAINKLEVDQHSIDAYALRQKLTRPGIIDSFRDLTDARNSLGSQAFLLTQFMNRQLSVAAAADNHAESQSRRNPVKSKRPQLSPPDYNDAEARLAHVWRLFMPISSDEPIARMLAVHFSVIKMMLEEVRPPNTTTQSPEHQDLADCDETISETISLITTTNIAETENFSIELGIIPPLFYLATSDYACQISQRRRAVHFLRTNLTDRKEGAWSGLQAGRIAEELVNLKEDELRSKTVSSSISFEIVEPQTSTTNQPSRRQANTSRARGTRELWMHYDTDSALLDSTNGRPIDAGPRRMRKRILWSGVELLRLPKNINELVRNAGYQGYFSDAARPSDTSASPV